jgi:hydroxymethylpyrimidine pyrophosphatase-like HAD family hydrolase
VDSLPGLKFIAGFNGGVVVRRDFPLKENLLPAPTGEQVVQIVLEHQSDACLYTNRDWFVGHLAAYRVNREQRTAVPTEGAANLCGSLRSPPRLSASATTTSSRSERDL